MTEKARKTVLPTLIISNQDLHWCLGNDDFSLTITGGNKHIP